MLYKLLKLCGETIDKIIWKFYADRHLRDFLTKIGEYKKKTETQEK